MRLYWSQSGEDYANNVDAFALGIMEGVRERGWQGSCIHALLKVLAPGTED